MSAEELLKGNEKAALSNDHFVSRVTGKNKKISFSGKKSGSFPLVVFVTLLFGFGLFIFGSGEIIPSTISERLLEETDVQYADAVQSKELVFQQALFSGDIPSDTVEKLKKYNVLVGYSDGNSFIEANKVERELSLKYDNKIIGAGEFINEVNQNTGLYNAFNEATYSRVAYYYDSSAEETFKRLGTTRNNYSSDSDFEEVMNKIMGSGSNIEVGSVVLVKKERVNDKGEKEIYYEYKKTSGGANSKELEVSDFINEVRNKNGGDSDLDATLSAANALNIADNTAKEQRSSLFFLGFMENVSKMKAGKGNESKVNEMMNYLSSRGEAEVVNVKSGEVETIAGTMLESPSLYAILSGEKIDPDKVENYASDRVLMTIENRTNSSISSDQMFSSVSSTNKNVTSSIGKYVNNNVLGNEDDLNTINTTINHSLIDNSMENLKGPLAGEFLVEGAVNVGRELAKASGATAGDAEAVKSYARLSSSVLAMDAKVDRMTRSPFDITSKNTFLGSIIYNLAISVKPGSILSYFSFFPRVISNSLFSVLPSASAEDDNNGYLTVFGNNCKTLNNIGAVGSASCATDATFDTSTLNDTFNDPGFIKFVEDNTFFDGSKRVINKDSILRDFIIYNNERVTSVGVMDGGVLNSIKNNSNSLSYSSDILSNVLDYLNASESEKRIASGAAFVNSANNPDWETYKYAQRYVSIARATEALRMTSSDQTAYNNITFFEGSENPVIALLNEYYSSLLASEM